MSRPPAPATAAEQLARANQALPAGLEIRRTRGRYGHRIFLIYEHGLEVGRTSNLIGAIFIASGRAKITPPPSEIPSHG